MPQSPNSRRVVGRVLGVLALAAALVTTALLWGHPAPTGDADSARSTDVVARSMTREHSGSSPAASPLASPTPITPPDPAAEAAAAAAAAQAAEASAPPAAAPAAPPVAQPAKPAPAKPAPAPAAPPPPAPAPAPPAPAPQTGLADEIVRLTNVERAKGGLAPLSVSACLTDQSTKRTAVLVAQNRFEHDPLDPVVAACGMQHGMGENLSLGYGDAASTVAGWMASDGHRKNLMNPTFTQIGVGCAVGPKGPLCGQLFTG